jgi:hypothetical protein
MIMRFRPANISLINRRHYLPRLLLTLSSKKQIQKPPQRFEDVDRVTPYQLPVGPPLALNPKNGLLISKMKSLSLEGIPETQNIHAQRTWFVISILRTASSQLDHEAIS